MTFKKGGIKTGGRESGVGNKTTKPMKDAIELLVTNQFDKVEPAINKLWATDPKTALKMMLDLMEFFMPKMKAVDHNFGDSDVTINVSYKRHEPST